MKKIIYKFLKFLIKILRWVQRNFFEKIVLLTFKYIHFKDNKILEKFGRKLNAVKLLFLEIFSLFKKTFNIKSFFKKRKNFSKINLIKKVDNLEKNIDNIFDNIKQYGLFHYIYLYVNNFIVIIKKNIRIFFEIELIEGILLKNRIFLLFLKYLKNFNSFLEKTLVYKNLYFMNIYIFFFIFFFFISGILYISYFIIYFLFL